MCSPLISIVIPTFARPQRLRECLQAIADLRAEGIVFEVVVVDDGSPDSLVPLVAEFAGRLAISLLEQERGGPGSARNRGGAAARGRYFAFLDDDCRPAPDWLALLMISQVATLAGALTESLRWRQLARSGTRAAEV